MIIMVRGPQGKQKNAAALTALLSAMTATIKSKKTLAIQITSYNSEAIIDYLVGKQLKEEEINAGFKVWRDEGIDALLVRSETAALTKEHYDNTVTPITEKENLFDVLKPTKNKEFFAFLNHESILNILDGAKSVYDYVFVLVAEMPELIDLVKQKADETIIVIPQAPKIDIVNPQEKALYVINDYEKNSIYTVKDIMKEYGIRKAYVLPHNYQYRDALIQKTLFDFVRKNKKDIKSDVNYEFTASISKMLSAFISGMSADDEEDIEETVPKVKPKEEHLIPDYVDDIPDDAVQEIIVKKGLFFKKKKLTVDL